MSHSSPVFADQRVHKASAKQLVCAHSRGRTPISEARGEETRNEQRLADLGEWEILNPSSLPIGRMVACAVFDHRSIFMHETMVVKCDRK